MVEEVKVIKYLQSISTNLIGIQVGQEEISVDQIESESIEKEPGYQEDLEMVQIVEKTEIDQKIQTQYKRHEAILII